MMYGKSRTRAKTVRSEYNQLKMTFAVKCQFIFDLLLQFCRISYIIPNENRRVVISYKSIIILSRNANGRREIKYFHVDVICYILFNLGGVFKLRPEGSIVSVLYANAELTPSLYTRANSSRRLLLLLKNNNSRIYSYIREECGGYIIIYTAVYTVRK